MRKGLGVIGCLLMLTACAQTPVQPIVTGFRCEVEMLYDGECYRGVLDRSQQEVAVLTISAPDEVDGLMMTWDGEEVLLSYLGMELALDNAASPVGVAVKAICETLDDCVANLEGEAVSSTFENEGSCGRYTLSFDENSGLPISMTLPALSLEILFSAWELPV